MRYRKKKRREVTECHLRELLVTDLVGRFVVFNEVLQTITAVTLHKIKHPTHTQIRRFQKRNRERPVRGLTVI